MPGKFIITCESQYWVFTLIQILDFYIKLSNLVLPPSTLCTQKCCPRVSLVVGCWILYLRWKKWTQQPRNLSPVKLNYLILKRKLCHGTVPLTLDRKGNSIWRGLYCQLYIYKGIHFNLQSKPGLCYNQSVIRSLFRTFNTSSTNNLAFQQYTFIQDLLSGYIRC